MHQNEEYSLTDGGGSIECNCLFFLSSTSLKVEYDKLANEKTEMQRHYVMVRYADVIYWRILPLASGEQSQVVHPPSPHPPTPWCFVKRPC